MNKKYLKLSDVRKALFAYDKEEITFSRMVEILNEKIYENIMERDKEPYKPEYLKRYSDTEGGLNIEL